MTKGAILKFSWLEGNPGSFRAKHSIAANPLRGPLNRVVKRRKW